MRLESCQYGHQNGIEIRIKILNININFSPPYCTSKNHQELTWITMQVYTGGTGPIRFNIPYGPGSKSGCVTVFTEWIVSCFDPCGPASNTWLTCTDPCRPTTANTKEKLVTIGLTHADPFRLAEIPTDPYLAFSYPSGQFLNPYIKSASSPLFRTTSILAHFHPHRLVTRLCVTVALYSSIIACLWIIGIWIEIFHSDWILFKSLHL
jgi:hypothetical protein